MGSGRPTERSDEDRAAAAAVPAGRRGMLGAPRAGATLAAETDGFTCGLSPGSRSETVIE